jgi:hypothetical protein
MPRECCPFVEIVLVETATGAPLEDFRFQTQRLRCKDTHPSAEPPHAAHAYAHAPHLLLQAHHSPDASGGGEGLARMEGAALSKPVGGATAAWHETFTYLPRPKDFWQAKSIRLRV